MTVALDQRTDGRPDTLGRRVVRGLRGIPRLVLIGLLRVYQSVISPMTGPTCRYYPSCSQYALIAVQRHGALRGSWLAARRLARCHPWTAGGVDDVPAARPPKISAHDHGRAERMRSSAR